MATKTIGAYTAAITIDGATNFMLIQPGNSSTAYKSINRNTLLGVTGQPADLTTGQGFSNKVLDNTNVITVKDNLLTLQDGGDVTRQAQFQLSGITSGQTRIYTLPDATSTLANLTSVQTMTNKTLTSPAITGGTIDNSTITVDAISEHTVSNGVTVSGLNIKSGKLNTNNSVVTLSITDGAVTPAKLQAGTGSGWTWTSFTPTFTNITIGNGTLACSYTQIGKLVVARIHFKLGTTSTVGTTPTITLPVPSVAGYIAGHWLGGIRIVAGGAGFTGYLQWASTTTALLLALNSAATYVSDTSANFTSAIPGTWTTNDSFDGTIMFEAA